MRCLVLGSFEVRADGGELITVAGAKERQLLALLASACPSVVSVDRLLELLWDGEPPLTARKSLQAHVVRLRSALEPERPRGSPGRYVVRRRAGYALSMGRDELDSLAFTDLVARGRSLLSAGDANGARPLLAEALDLWRGEPYADWPDSAFAGMERRRLEGVWVNATVAFFEAELELGRHEDSVPELERMVTEQPLNENWWSLLAVALYRSGRQADALAAVRRARSHLADELGLDPGPRLRSVEQAVLVHDRVLDIPRQAGANGLVGDLGARRPSVRKVEGCPYKGLSTYQIEDAGLFHGRDRLVVRLVGAVVDNPLLVVSGSSGAGKSSVVRAGLLPRLASGVLPGSDQWRPVVVTPGEHAVDALASLTGEPEQTDRVVLVCDQLEQLWSPQTVPAERVAFLDNVLGLLDDGAVTRCVFVVRGDHVGRLAEHSELAERMVGALVLVPPMTEQELREVVEAPAEMAGLLVETELTDLVIQDVAGHAGGLPLLSTALASTWERRRGDVLTLAGYLAAGGVAGAVARSAEAVFASFDVEGKEIARQVLIRLADQEEQGTLRGRRMPLSELALSGPHPDATRAVVETLTARRLVAMEGGHLEIAHEALLGAWPRLASWLADDAVGRSVRRHVAPAALEWDRNGRPTDELYRGARLDAVVDWAASPHSGVTQLEREFLEAGVARSTAKLAEAQGRARREAAGRRRTRRFAAGLTAALVLALVAAALAVRYQRSADDRAAEAKAASTVADANRLAALSTTARSLDLSLLLAVAGVRTAATPATEDGLLNALVEHRRAVGVFQFGDGGVFETSLSPDGRTMMATIGGGSPRVVAWTIGSSRPPRVLDDWWPDHIAVSPDGGTLVAAGVNDRPALWAYTADGESLQVIRGRHALGGYPRDVAFTADGKLLMFVGNVIGKSPGFFGTLEQVDLHSGTVRALMNVGATTDDDVWLDAAFTDDASGLVVSTVDQRRAFRVDVATGSIARVHVQQRRNATSLEFIATPDGLVQTWSDGAVTRYDVSGQPVQVLDVHRAPVRDVLVLPDGRRAVTAGDAGEVELWDIDRRTGMWSLGESLVGHAGPVKQIEVLGNGETLLTASTDGQQISWDLTDDAGFGSAYPGLEDRWVSNRVGVVVPGKLVVAPTRTLSEDPNLHGIPVDVAATFMDPRNGRVVDQVVVGDTEAGLLFGSSVAVSPDTRLVAVTSAFATTVLDTQTREVVARIKMPIGRGDYVWCAQWTPDGSRLLLGIEGEGYPGLAVVDTSTWKVARAIEMEGGSPQVLEWTPDGSVLAAGINYTGTIQLFDQALHKVRTIDLGEAGDVFDLAFSPDGKLLAAGGVGGQISIVDTTTWKLVHDPVRVSSRDVDDVEWLPDSNTAVAASSDETASLYDVRRDLVRSQPLLASSDPGDGNTNLMPGITDEIVVLNEGDPGHRYPLEPARWLASACSIAGRDLTPAEWARYVPDEPYRPVCDLG